MPFNTSLISIFLQLSKLFLNWLHVLAVNYMVWDVIPVVYHFSVRRITCGGWAIQSAFSWRPSMPSYGSFDCWKHTGICILQTTENLEGFNPLSLFLQPVGIGSMSLLHNPSVANLLDFDACVCTNCPNLAPQFIKYTKFHLHLQAFRGAIHHEDTMALTLKFKNTHKKHETRELLMMKISESLT